MPRKPGRPKTGKRSNPGYIELSGYVPVSVQRAAKHFLIDNDQFKDMGDLLEAAVLEFLQRQNTEE